MKSPHYLNILYIAGGIMIGLLIAQYASIPSVAEENTKLSYEYAYAWGILETEGDAITLTIPETEKTDSDWGEIDVYKTIEFSIAFEGGAQGTEMYAINTIGDMGWELVCKYYIPEGYEKGHHYWFRRVKS